VKTLNVTFTDAEYTELLNKKVKAKLSWHDFILKVGESKEES